MLSGIPTTAGKGLSNVKRVLAAFIAVIVPYIKFVVLFTNENIPPPKILAFAVTLTVFCPAALAGVAVASKSVEEGISSVHALPLGLVNILKLFKLKPLVPGSE